jgi:alanyl aminopeptidase
VLISALSQVRDPKAHAAMLEVTLDPALDLRETQAIVFWSTTEATRASSETFFRAHDEELTKRLPKDEVTGTLAGQVRLFTGACDANTRDDRVAEVTKRFASQPGGARVVAQAIEEMDQCIATRAVLEPEVRGWLGGVKIAKPTPQKTVDKAAEKTKSKKAKSH